jgi:hypothetical protein
MKRVRLLIRFGEMRNSVLISSKGKSTMTKLKLKLKLLGVAALLSSAMMSPVLAQQAVQEPGAAAFYQSLGVGSHSYPAANAFAYTRNFDLLVVPPPVKRHARRSSRH